MERRGFAIHRLYQEQTVGNWDKFFILLVGFLILAALYAGYRLTDFYAPEALNAYGIVIGAFLFFALMFLTGTAHSGTRVRWYLWMVSWFRSWIAFILGLALMAGVWYGCYFVVKTYCPVKYLVYFKWGIYIAVPFTCLMLIFNELLVKWMTGAKRIREREQCPKLWDAVHKVTPWHARPYPRIYLLPDSGMNAISFGWGLPFLSAVGATRGLLNRLDQAEVDAVMAHEIGHVINKDILVSMVLGTTVMIMATTGWMLLRLAPWSGGDSSDRKGSGGAAALLIAMAIGVVMYLGGRLLGIILQAFVSRQREYAADATSARIIGSGARLKSALIKIVDDPSIGSRSAGAAAGFLCTADPEPADVMATHPSIENRLKALDLLES